MEACGLLMEDVVVGIPVAWTVWWAEQSVSSSPRCMPGCEPGVPQEVARESVEEIGVCIRDRNHPRPVQVYGAGYPHG
jgi:hypothetical protein